MKLQTTPQEVSLEPISVCKLFGPLSFPHVIFHNYFFLKKRKVKSTIGSSCGFLILQINIQCNFCAMSFTQKVEVQNLEPF